MGIDSLIAQIQQAKKEFYERYACEPNMVSLGKEQLRELSEYLYLAKLVGKDLLKPEVKDKTTRWSHATICGLHIESGLTPLGACIFKGNKELETQIYYEKNGQEQFKILPENEVKVRYLPPDFSWLEQHAHFSKRDIEVFQNEL